MDKRALVKFPVQTAPDEWVELARRTECAECLISAQIITVKDKKILLLHLYPQQQIRNGDTKAAYRVFLDKEDYITQDLKSKSIKWLTSSLEHLIGYWNMDRRCLLVNEDSSRAMRQFFKCTEMPFEALMKFQESVIEKRRNKRYGKIIERIDAAMEPIPPLPEDFVQWMRETALHDSRYFIYTYRRGSAQTGTCTWCGKQAYIEGVRHLKPAVCPHCGSTVTSMASGRMSRYKTDDTWCALLQPYPGGFVVRYFRVWREFRDHPASPKDDWCEYLRDVYVGDKMTRYEWDIFRQSKKMRWCDNTRHFATYKAAVYSANLNAVLDGTIWKYSALRQMAEARPGYRFNLYDYLKCYQKYPFIEYLVKLRLYKLTSQFISRGDYFSAINTKGKNLTEILRVDKSQIPLLQEMDAGEDEIELLSQARMIRLSITSEQVEYLAKNFQINGELLQELTEFATLHKTLKYLRQGCRTDSGLKDRFRDWRDYLRFCRKLGYDLTNEFIVFPKDLKAAHDRAAALVKKRDDRLAAMKRAKREQLIANMYEPLQVAYGWKNKRFIIRVPKTAGEITAEGQTLHHCVGTYIDRVASGKCQILFLRRIEKPDTPFFTIEVNDFKVVQCRGKCNCAMTPDVVKAMERYQREVLDVLRHKGQRGEGQEKCVIGFPISALAV